MPRSLCVWVFVALALLVPASRVGVASSRAVTSADTSASDRVSIAPPTAPRFRLGDAARPFGWSTAIGDFNTDGKPDVAIADHIGQWASEYSYRIELLISGQVARDVTFESTHDAVSISLADVDRDNDLDIVVGVPLSAETVGVWLNDGHGHFTSGKVQPIPASLQGQAALDARSDVRVPADRPAGLHTPQGRDRAEPVGTRAHHARRTRRRPRHR